MVFHTQVLAHSSQKPLKFLSAESAKGVFCYVDAETFEKMPKNGSSQVVQGTNLVIRGLKLSVPPIDPLGKGEEKEADKNSERLGLESFLVNTGRLETEGHLEKAWERITLSQTLPCTSLLPAVPCVMSFYVKTGNLMNKMFL